MSPHFRNKRRRPRIIRDRRGLPARRMPVERASRHFELLMHWVRCNGICVITKGGKTAFVMIDPARNPRLMRLIEASVVVAPLRKRNPGGVFTLADKVFGNRARADLWMVHGTWNEGETRPLDLLGSTEGVEAVLGMLHGIQHGMFG